MSNLPSRAGQDLYLRIHCVNVFVRDQDRSLRFYLDRLGFHLAFDARLQTGERWVAVAPPDGTAILSLIAPKPNSLQYKLIGRATQVVFVTEDVTAKFQEWSKRGVRFLHTPRLRRIKYDRETQGHDAEARGPHSSASSMLLGEQTTIWGGVFTRFRDVDGNSFSLVSFDEVTQAVEAQRRTICREAGIRTARGARTGNRKRGAGEAFSTEAAKPSRAWTTRAFASRRGRWAATTTIFWILGRSGLGW